MQAEQVEEVTLIDFPDFSVGKKFKAFEIHAASWCDCDEELRYLYECNACGVLSLRKEDSPPEIGDHLCELGPIKLVQSVYSKTGEVFVKECEAEKYFKRRIVFD